MKFRIFRGLIFILLVTSALPGMPAIRQPGAEADGRGTGIVVSEAWNRQDPQDDRKKDKKDEKEGKKEEKKPEVKEVPKSRRQERPSSVKKDEKK